MNKVVVKVFKGSTWRKRHAPAILGLVLAVVLGSATFVLLLQKTSAEQPNISEYATPTSNSNPGSMVKGPDGNVWFTENNANKIGRIVTAGTITEYTVPDPYSEPGQIAVGPDGNMWFTATDPNTTHEAIGRITTAGTATTFTTPTSTNFVSGPCAGPDGNVWFTEVDSNKVAKITPSGTITEYTAPSSGAQPDNIKTGPDGNLWFTEQGASKIGRITPSGTITEFSLPAPGSNLLSQMTLGPDGNMWFAQQSPAAVDRVTTSGLITQYNIPSAPSSIYMAAGPDGNIWFTGDHTVGQVTPSGTVTEFSTGTTTPIAITAGPDGNMWFTGGVGATGQIGRVTPSGVVTIFTTPSSSPQAIVTGDDGNIYFADPLANKVGILDLLPTVTATSARPASYGSRLSITGYNFTNVTALTLGGTPITQSPCPMTPTNPCYTIESDTNITVRTTTSITTPTNIQMTNSWGQGASVAVSLLSTGINAAGTFAPHFVEPGDRSPYSIAKGPDGNIWFTEYNPDTVAVITPAGQVTEFPLANPNSGVGIVATGPDGNLWFTEGNTNKIGRITPSGTITEFPVPTSSSGPDDITAGPDGNMWFGEYGASQVGRITPTGTITEFAAGGSVLDIATGPDGNIWIAKQGGTISKMTTSGSLTTFSIPSANNISDITAGPDGALWFTDSDSNKIGTITTAGAVTEYPIATPNSYPLGITAGPDGNMWFTENSANKIGRITPTGTITEFDFSSSDDYGAYIASDGSNLWFTTSDSVDELQFATPPPSGGGSGNSGGGQSSSGSGTSTTGTTTGTGGSTTTNSGSGSNGSTSTEQTTPPPPASPIDLSQQSDFSSPEGYATDVTTGDQFVFKPSGSQDQQVTITVGTITPTSASLTVAPTSGGSSQTVTLSPDIPKSIDVNDDNTPDVTFIATNLTYGHGKITFAVYHAAVTAAPSATTPESRAATRFIDRIPHGVLAGFPYLLFAVLAAILVVLLRNLWREVLGMRQLRAFYILQADVASQKQTFVQLASHYLRTPLTMITSGAQLAAEPDEPSVPTDVMRTLNAKARSLAKQVEATLSGITDEAGQVPTVSEAFVRTTMRQTFKQPVFYVPAVVFVLAIAASYKLLLLAGAAKLAHINVLIQAAIAILLMLCLYGVLRGFQMRQREQEMLQSALKAQSRLDEQRNSFIVEAAASLRTEVESLERAAQQLPKTVAGNAIHSGIARLSALLDRFELVKDLRLMPALAAGERISLTAIWQRLASTVTAATKQNIAITLPSDKTIVNLRSVPLFTLVVSSLLDNAVAYSAPGQTVTIESRSISGQTTIEVTDQGKGMPAQQASEWFKPFSKREGALSFDHEGAGLSLYLDRLIMTYLGGDISLQSAPGKGTTARVVLAEADMLTKSPG